MNDDVDIPIPDNSGASGKQKAGDTIMVLEESKKPLEGLHIAKTVSGLASSHARGFSGEVTSALVAGITTQQAYDIQDLKETNNNLNNLLETKRNELEQSRIQNAVLFERIRAEGQSKHLRNLCITLGTSFIGTGIYLSRSKLDSYAYGAYGVGLLLLLVGWFTGPKGKAQ